VSKIIHNINSNIKITSNQNLPRSGAFEITLDEKLIYSKFQTGKFPTEKEIITILQERP